MTWFVTSAASVTDGTNVVTVGDSADLSIINHADGLLLDGEAAVEISHTQGQQIILVKSWSKGTRTSVAGTVIPTAGDFQQAITALNEATALVQSKFGSVGNLTDWEQGPNADDDTSPPNGNDELKGRRALNDDDGGVQYVMTPAEMERFATEQAAKIDDVEAWHTEIEVWHGQINTWYIDIQTKHGEVSSWHSDVQTWYPQIDSWQQQVTTDAIAASGSASSAANSVTAAAAEVTKASEWADSDTEVETGRYSAKYWAGQAEEIVGGDYVTGNDFTTALATKADKTYAETTRIYALAGLL